MLIVDAVRLKVEGAVLRLQRAVLRWAEVDQVASRAAPHCDARILHAPGECPYCDDYPDWQELRARWGICFTGHSPDEAVVGPGGLWWRDFAVPYPADVARPPGSASDHSRWPGNRPEGYHLHQVLR